jgi:alkylation response protein AidB-like acyl-CoA dehydrogenase
MSDITPVADIVFALRAYGGLDRLIASGAFPDLDGETAQAIVEEASRFAEDQMLPLNQPGDRIGVTLANGVVTTPPGWKETYRRWIEAGWNGIGSPPEWGGQGLPVVLQTALQEIWNTANAAFAVGPMLNGGAVKALGTYASEDLQKRYLPKLVSGEWMVTMDLSEPQAGSELGALTTRAERAEDGSYRIFGQKIFITYGDHDFTDNIVHLVLARIANAPAGTPGISMFLVPKVLEDGSRNDVVAAANEHKLGMHGSPTCTMVYGEGGKGATGWLVGKENRGLVCMFMMMNHARLDVGAQGVGVASRALRLALAFAAERRQGHALGSPRGEMSPIGAHPDIQRELLHMTALTASSRAICYACGEAFDMSIAAPEAERGAWADRASLLIPVAKAFATDAANAVTSAGIQVHGGAGYIEETGAAQLLRDARVFAIYEGTNGIQAIDFATRKLKLGGGQPLAALINEIAETAVAVAEANRPDFGLLAQRLDEAGKHLASATAYLAKCLAGGHQQPVLAGATPFMRLFGLAFGGALLAKGALRADDDNRDRAIALARFHGESLLGEVASLASAVIDGAEGLQQAAQRFDIGRPPA